MLVCRQIFLDVIVEVVVVVVDHVVALFRLAAIQIHAFQTARFFPSALLLARLIHVKIVLPKIEAGLLLPVELSEEVISLGQMFVGAVGLGHRLRHLLLIGQSFEI